MDAFEELVGEILWHEGYWIQQSVKIDLTKEEKKAYGKPSLARPEIDLVAYKGKTAELLLIECKSYIDSRGVSIDAFGVIDPKKDRYKLFNDKKLSKLIVEKLVKQLADKGLCPETVKTKFVLIAGHIQNSSRQDLGKLFKDNGWLLWDESWLQEKLIKMSKAGYENSVAMITAKLLKGRTATLHD